MYAAGKIPGGFNKREGRPGEDATLTSRLIDRPIRPLFPKGYRHDVQVISIVMSVDPNCSPEMAAMIGSSMALSVSDIPFERPIAGVNVGLVDGEFVINPNVEQREVSLLDLQVAGHKDAINMVEAGAKEVTEETMLNAILFGHKEIQRLVEFQEAIIEGIQPEKAEFIPVEIEASFEETVRAKAEALDIISAIRTEENNKEILIFLQLKKKF